MHFRRSLIWSNLCSYIKSSRSVCPYVSLKITKNFRDIDCGCLVCWTWICRCNRTYSILLLLLLLFFLGFFCLFVCYYIHIFICWFLLEKSYFNATILSKVLNNWIKKTLLDFRLFDFAYRAKSKSRKSWKFSFLF